MRDHELHISFETVNVDLLVGDFTLPFSGEIVSRARKWQTCQFEKSVKLGNKWYVMTVDLFRRRYEPPGDHDSEPRVDTYDNDHLEIGLQPR